MGALNGRRSGRRDRGRTVSSEEEGHGVSESSVDVVVRWQELRRAGH